MRPSTNIVAGCFRGGEIEPGTFHVLAPRPAESPNSEAIGTEQTDHRSTLSGLRLAPLGANVQRSMGDPARARSSAEAGATLVADPGPAAAA